MLLLYYVPLPRNHLTGFPDCSTFWVWELLNGVSDVRQPFILLTSRKSQALRKPLPCFCDWSLHKFLQNKSTYYGSKALHPKKTTIVFNFQLRPNNKLCCHTLLLTNTSTHLHFFAISTRDQKRWDCLSLIESLFDRPAATQLRHVWHGLRSTLLNSFELPPQHPSFVSSASELMRTNMEAVSSSLNLSPSVVP